MNQNIRYCSLLGHEEYPVFHICTLHECGLTTRWCCPECIQQGIHHHNQQNNSHVMNRKGILSKLMNEYEMFKNFSDNQKTNSSSFLENILIECQSLERKLIDFIKYIEKQIQNLTSDEDQARFEQYLRYLNDNNFSQLDDDKINQLLNITQKYDQNIKQLLEQRFDTIVKQINQIEEIIKDYQDNKNHDSNSMIDFKNRKYITQEIDQSDNYYCSSISKNELYLAYGGYNKVLRIYDIKLKKISKEIKLDNYLQVCQFTHDSSELYVGLVGGYVYGFNAQDYFKQIYKYQIHLNDVNNIITIQNQFLITCSFDQSIIKTDIKSNKQIFKLTGHTDNIIAIDYSDKDEIIISGSGDTSIKVWNCKNYSIIINKNQAHNNHIRQIQLINNNINILSLDKDGNLYKWKIDLIKKDLIQLQQFIDQNKIFNFQQVNQDKNLLLICNNYAKIQNQNGETLNIVQHGGQNNYTYECKQLDNLKYMQIRALDKIILAITQD